MRDFIACTVSSLHVLTVLPTQVRHDMLSLVGKHAIISGVDCLVHVAEKLK